MYGPPRDCKRIDRSRENLPNLGNKKCGWDLSPCRFFATKRARWPIFCYAGGKTGPASANAGLSFLSTTKPASSQLLDERCSSL
jgi:hypothetical protein